MMLSWAAFVAAASRRVRAFVLLALGSQLVIVFGGLYFIVLAAWPPARLSQYFAITAWNALIVMLGCVLIWYMVTRYVHVQFRGGGTPGSLPRAIRAGFEVEKGR